MESCPSTQLGLHVMRVSLAVVTCAALLVAVYQSAASKPTTRVVRWYAPFLADSGFGSEATQFIEALDSQRHFASLPTVLEAVQFAEPAVFEPESPTLRNAMLRRYRGHACIIAICHSTPNFWVPSEFPSWDRVAPCPPREATIKIGRAMYETDSLPKSWIARLNKMDEIWVPTRFARDVFLRSGIASEKLVVVPEPVDVHFYSQARCRVQKSAQVFVYLAVFKWEERKGWKELFRAFLEEFRPKDPVQLLIKTTVFHLPPGSTPRSLAEAAFPEIRSRGPQIRFTSDRISEEELLQKFFCMADALLAPSYGEGWGRVPAEAASMGLPVLFTNYSGPTEFLSHMNAFPIEVESMVRANDEGHMWAKPSVSHLRQGMRKVYEDRAAVAAIGEAARKTMVDKYSNQVIGKYLWEVLGYKCSDTSTKSSRTSSEEL